MHVSQYKKNQIVIDFSDNEIKEYVAVAKTQGWTLRSMVSHALHGYLGLMRDVAGNIKG